MNTNQLHNSEPPQQYAVGVAYTPYNVNPMPQALVLQPSQYSESAVCGVAYPTQQSVMISCQLGNKPTAYVCRTCNELIVTRVIKKPTCKTHCCAGLLCLFMCWPCMCIPYCMTSWTNASHYCPKCSAYMGTFKG